MFIKRSGREIYTPPGRKGAEALSDTPIAILINYVVGGRNKFLALSEWLWSLFRMVVDRFRRDEYTKELLSVYLRLASLSSFKAP